MNLRTRKIENTKTKARTCGVYYCSRQVPPKRATSLTHETRCVLDFRIPYDNSQQHHSEKSYSKLQNFIDTNQPPGLGLLDVKSSITSISRPFKMFNVQTDLSPEYPPNLETLEPTLNHKIHPYAGCTHSLFRPRFVGLELPNILALAVLIHRPRFQIWYNWKPRIVGG